MKTVIKVVAFAVLAGGVGYLSTPSAPPLGNPVVEVTRAASQARVQEAIQAIEAKRPLAAAEGDSGTPVQAEVKARLETAYDFIAKSRNSLHRETEREAIYAKLVSDPEAMAAASYYLSDLNQVRKDFGDRQAEARMYSIGLLHEAAKRGNSQPLQQTALKLIATLKTKNPVPPGQQRDLEDLIASYVDVHKEAAFENTKGLAAALGYTPELRKAFVAGIYIALQSTYAKDQIVAKLEQAGISPNAGTSN